jgi:hypothetical protein
MAVFAKARPYQFFHVAGAEVRDVLDAHSALAYCTFAGKAPREDANKRSGPSSAQVKMVPGASGGRRLDTYPAWSPDGQYLYYCSAPALWKDLKAFPPERYAEVKYDLMRMRYDLDADRWGEPEPVLSARQTGLSILMPRISPDGRFLLCCMCPYSCFPPFQPSSDLYLVELATREYRRLPISSDAAESWHSWSSNGRWIAFSSKRQVAPLTRCYLSYIDAGGQAYKPFILPQSDPEYYGGLLEAINVPELIPEPVPVTAAALARAARSPEALVVDGAAVLAPEKASEPWQDGHR